MKAVLEKSGATSPRRLAERGGAAALFWAGRKAAFRRSAASRRTIFAWTVRFRGKRLAEMLEAIADLGGQVRPALRQRIPCR